MFVLFVLIAMYISESSKNYNHKYTLQYHPCSVIGLCNFSINRWFDLISLLTPYLRFSYQKNYKPKKRDLFDIHHTSWF